MASEIPCQSKAKITVVTADDDPVARRGICALLQAATDIVVVGEAADGAGAQRLVAALEPDVLLLDFVMPGNHALAVEQWMRQHYPGVITLVLTGHDRDAFVAQTIESQAQGFLLKKDAPQHLVDNIRLAVQGECLITGGQLARAQSWYHAVKRHWDSLTLRQCEILMLLAQGCSNQDIEQNLHISRRTVETHIQNILGKLGLHSTREAIAWVWEHNLLEEELAVI